MQPLRKPSTHLSVIENILEVPLSIETFRASFGNWIVKAFEIPFTTTKGLMVTLESPEDGIQKSITLGPKLADPHMEEASIWEPLNQELRISSVACGLTLVARPISIPNPFKRLTAVSSATFEESSSVELKFSFGPDTEMSCLEISLDKPLSQAGLACCA